PARLRVPGWRARLDFGRAPVKIEDVWFPFVYWSPSKVRSRGPAAGRGGAGGDPDAARTGPRDGRTAGRGENGPPWRGRGPTGRDKGRTGRQNGGTGRQNGRSPGQPPRRTVGQGSGRGSHLGGVVQEQVADGGRQNARHALRRGAEVVVEVGVDDR